MVAIFKKGPKELSLLQLSLCVNSHIDSDYLCSQDDTMDMVEQDFHDQLSKLA